MHLWVAEKTQNTKIFKLINLKIQAKFNISLSFVDQNLICFQIHLDYLIF